MSKFSDSLVFLRKRAGLSQQELADKMEVSRSLIGMYEAGQRMPSFEMLEAIADIFNVNIDFLIGHKEIGEHSEAFRANLAYLTENYSDNELAEANIDPYEVKLIIDGAISLSLDTACQLADQFGESMDSMLSLNAEKSAPDDEDGLDMTIINLILSLPENKKSEAVNYLRYLAENADK